MNFKPLILSGTLLGVGLGGFLDGILLHQIFQVHNMLSNRLPPDTLVNVEINMFWDGLFHLFTWIVTLLGICFLWKSLKREDVPRSTPVLVGSMIFGWGLFNFIEGLIDHQILAIHHVMERAPANEQIFYDMAFLVFAILQIFGGIFVIRMGQRREEGKWK